MPDAMLPWRSTVIAFKQPRRQLVQPVTRIEGDTVILQVRPALRLCRVALAVPCLSLALPPEPSAPTIASTFTGAGIRSVGCRTVRELRCALRAIASPAPSV